MLPCCLLGAGMESIIEPGSFRASRPSRDEREGFEVRAQIRPASAGVPVSARRAMGYGRAPLFPDVEVGSLSRV